MAKVAETATRTRVKCLVGNWPLASIVKTSFDSNVDDLVYKLCQYKVKKLPSEYRECK